MAALRAAKISSSAHLLQPRKGMGIGELASSWKTRLRDGAEFRVFFIHHACCTVFALGKLAMHALRGLARPCGHGCLRKLADRASNGRPCDRPTDR